MILDLKIPAPKLNIYTCTNCGDHIVTKDLVEGVTPFIISCQACAGKMQSSFYRVWDLRMAPTHVWYKPTAPELAQMNTWSQQHASQGGLFLREATEEEMVPWRSELPNPHRPADPAQNSQNPNNKNLN